MSAGAVRRSSQSELGPSAFCIADTRISAQVHCGQWATSLFDLTSVKQLQQLDLRQVNSLRSKYLFRPEFS